MKHFTDKVAAITGAGSGMGRALAIRLAREGCHLALADRHATSLEETARLAEQIQGEEKAAAQKVFARINPSARLGVDAPE